MEITSYFPDTGPGKPTPGISRGSIRVPDYENIHDLFIFSASFSKSGYRIHGFTIKLIHCQKLQMNNIRMDMINLRNFLLSAVLAAVLIIPVSGCSVFMAAKQPEKKDISLLKEGVSRTVLISEFGAPVISEYKDSRRYEIFKFVQGYSTGAKAGRAFFHGAASVVTLGLWELVGTPTEITFSGDEMAFLVKYDENDVAEEVVAIKKD
jgi:uncharacterized membrane protein